MRSGTEEWEVQVFRPFEEVRVGRPLTTVESPKHAPAPAKRPSVGKNLLRRLLLDSSVEPGPPSAVHVPQVVPLRTGPEPVAPR